MLIMPVSKLYWANIQLAGQHCDITGSRKSGSSLKMNQAPTVARNPACYLKALVLGLSTPAYSTSYTETFSDVEGNLLM